jgi:hypothetical protein
VSSVPMDRWDLTVCSVRTASSDPKAPSARMASSDPTDPAAETAATGAAGTVITAGADVALASR